MTPARWGARFRGAGVLAVTSSGATTYRPCKVAAGITNTFRRHRRAPLRTATGLYRNPPGSGGHSEIANTLAVRGTLDVLARWRWNIQTTYADARCPACGATHPNVREARLSLSISGRRRLAVLRGTR